jgi:lipopolysaccharide biosynthesis glycosyltransferase
MPANAHHIALCCNGTMLPGLHATIGSLVRNLSRRDDAVLSLFLQDVTEAEAEALRETVQMAGGVGLLELRESDASAFKDLPSFHGDWMTYMRLFLPKLLPNAGLIAYLDSDLLVNTDVGAFFDLPLKDYALAAVPGERVDQSLDTAFFNSVGLANDQTCFNAGILVLNAEQWRARGLVDACIKLGRDTNETRLGHDQSLLVALFAREFYHLPAKYNIGLQPSQRFTLEDGIYHFVGSPKPWDPFGRWFHKGWAEWEKVNLQTKFDWKSFLARHSKPYWKRAWNLRRSYLRTLVKG